MSRRLSLAFSSLALLTAAAIDPAFASESVGPPHSAPTQVPAFVATYFGGNGLGNAERINDMVVDPVTQDIIVVGETNSPNAPITAGAADTLFSGGSEGFVARFSAELGTLKAATYFGGDGLDVVYGVALDPRNGDVLIVGYTESPSLPGIAGAPQSIAGGDVDAFVARLSPNLDQVYQSTFLGRLGKEYGARVKVRQSDRSVFIVGNSTSLTLPGSAQGAQSTSAGGTFDGFIASYSSDLKTLSATTFQGGNGFDDIISFWINPSNDEVVVAGATTSTNLGNVAGAAQGQSAGGTDVQLARFSGDLGTRYRSSYYGGTANDSPLALEFDPVTNGLLVAGITSSPSLPGAVGTAQDHRRGSSDGFVVRFASDLGARGRASFVGGEGEDIVYAPQVNAGGLIVMTGETSSANFPGAPPVALGLGQSSTFVTRLASNMLGGFSSARWASKGPVTRGLALVQSGTDRTCVGGTTSGPGLPFTATGAQPNYGGGNSDGYITCIRDDQFPIFINGFDG